jgi:outer membrane receptor for ferrienterochelin and colicins
VFLLALLLSLSSLQSAQSAIVCSVTAGGAPVPGAEIVVAGKTYLTDARGLVRIEVSPGATDLTIVKAGFAPLTTTVTVAAGQQQPLIIELEKVPTVEETVTVSATRTDKRIEDQPMRVEVLDRDEIQEKQLMTPGDIVMMLNEMGGLRVQATSPSLGAASVRLQGMRGRYTRFLSDGLPLFGEGVGGLGLLQIPPTDLGQVEVIKGVASALYGAGALAGVVDLISRRPGKEPVREALVNRTTLGGTDTVLFVAQPFNSMWSGTLLVGGHWQDKNDVDDDGWADLAGYSRAVVRPRLFWDNHAGRSVFATAGVTWEQREGGTVAGRTLAATNAPFIESLDTVRIDGGVVAQMLVGGQYVVTARASATRQHHDHQLGETIENDVHNTLFGEVAVRGHRGVNTWVAGVAFERDAFDPRDVPAFAYTYSVPGVFAQDDIDISRWLTVSASGRVDRHNQFGTFFSPRGSMLVHGTTWNSRLSVGSGFFAPTPLTEDTEAAGLTRLKIDGPLEAEQGRSASWDVTRMAGPLTMTGTLFRYDLTRPVVVDRSTYTLSNLEQDTIITGAEAVATLRRAPFSVTATYTYARSLEGDGVSRAAVPLTPRHSAGLTGMWEREEWGRVGLECYLTGRQRLEDNPYRSESAAYVLFGGMVERRFGKLRVFVNAENLGNVRQTDWDPLLRSSRATDGRWTVDSWAPLDGRVINAGVRVAF